MNLVFKEKIFPVLFMAIVTVLCIAIVSGLFLYTKDLVLSNETLVLKKAVLFAADFIVPADNQEILDLYDDHVKEIYTGENHYPFYEIYETNGTLRGYVFKVQGPGLWGTLEAVIGYDKNLQVMTGIEFTKQNETPGLGARITEPWFKEQFRGKKSPVDMVPEGTATAANEVDAITGASRTSNFVLQIVNNISPKNLLANRQ